MSKDNRTWMWWAAEVDSPEEEPERYSVEAPTREAVIAAARSEFGPGAQFIIVEATQDGPFDSRPFDENGDCPLVEAIMEKFLDDNGQRWGEDSDPPMLDPARVLNDAFELYCRDNHAALMEAAWSFTASRNKEWLPAAVSVVKP